MVDARLPDHVKMWAQDTVRNAVRRNLDGPAKHFQSYGKYLSFTLTLQLLIRFLIRTRLSPYNKMWLVTCSCACSVVNIYDWLVNGTAQAQVQALMEEEHSFKEYTKVSL